MKIEVSDLLDLEHTISKDIFLNVKYPYEVLSKIHDFILELGSTLDSEEYYVIDDNIWINKSVKISDMATIIGPCIIDRGSEIRPGAYIRGNVIVGKNCVIGNSCEIKNSIIFDKSQIPHFNYVGDSILGYHSHLGAGVVLSNLKSDNSNVIIKGDENIDTGLRKMGSILGDNSEIGCNSVLCPGTVIGQNSNVYPLVMVRGVIPQDSIVKSVSNIVRKRENNG